MPITVLSKPGCVQCVATKKYLEDRQAPFTVVDVSQDQEAFDMIVEMGYAQVPVVIVGDDHWSGFQPDRLDAHIPALTDRVES